MIIVTSYRNPDLDGVACSIAYAELQMSATDTPMYRWEKLIFSQRFELLPFGNKVRLAIDKINSV